jgi:hypothetical protein
MDMTMNRIRGRLYLNLGDFAQVAPGRFTVARGGEVYRIEGGRSLGGSRSEWFVEGPALGGAVRCASVADALRLLDGDL